MVRKSRKLLPPRRWLIALSIFLSLFGGSRLAIWLLDYEPRCEQACDFDPSAAQPGCEPLRISVQLEGPAPRARKEAHIFYRVAIENRSCSTIRLPVRRFIWNFGTLRNSAGSGYELRVLDAAGKIVPLADRNLLSRTRLYRDRPDNDAFFRTAQGARPDKDGMVELRPGDSLSTMPAALSPYRTGVSDTVESDGSVAVGFVDIDAPIPSGAQAPPLGFTVLEGYAFPRAGKYSLEARFDGLTWLRPRRPLARLVPSPVRYLLENLELWQAPNSSPKTLRIASAYAELRVQP